MKHKDFFASCCLIFALSSSTMHSIEAREWQDRSSMMSEFCWGALTVVGAATGVYALGRLCGWWGDLSNEQLLERCRYSLIKVDTYQDMIHLINRGQHQWAESRTLFDEQLLYDVAVMKGRAVSIDHLISDVKSTIAELHKYHNLLDKRLLSLSHELISHEMQYMYNSMDAMLKQAKEALYCLNGVQEMLSEHRSYFYLFEVEDLLARKYSQELELLQHFGGDDYALTKGVRACALNKYQDAFALILYVKDIQQAIKPLERALERPAYNYAIRISYARSLLGSLHYVRDIIVSDKEYRCSLAEYERAQREHERLRLEQERVRAEQRIAAAKERKARAKEKQNRLTEQQIYEQRLQRHWY